MGESAMRKTGTAAAVALQPEAAWKGDLVSEMLAGHCHLAFMEHMLCPTPFYSQPNVILLLLTATLRSAAHVVQTKKQIQSP